MHQQCLGELIVPPKYVISGEQTVLQTAMQVDGVLNKSGDKTRISIFFS